MLYLDPFDPSLEEDFFESEWKESTLQVKTCLDGLRLGILVEIQLSLPLSLELLASLVEGLLFQKKDTETAVTKLSFSHWGLGDEGVEILLPYLMTSSTSLQSLSLTNCGLTARGFFRLLDGLAESSSPIRSLDCSRNNLLRSNTTTKRIPRQQQQQQHPTELLGFTFTQILPRLSGLRDLKLSAVGLYAASFWIPFWQGVASMTRLQSVDISHNSHVLEDLLQSLLHPQHTQDTTFSSSYLSQFSVKELILARGASSSACLEVSSEDITSTTSSSTLATLHKLRQELPSTLCRLGPISLVPLDRQSSVKHQAHHAQCQAALHQLEDDVWKNQYHRALFAPLKQHTRTGYDKELMVSSFSTTTTTTAILCLILEDVVGRGRDRRRLFQEQSSPHYQTQERRDASMAYWLLQECASLL